MFQSSAPAKVILFGEHAAVYGYPAVAAPVSSVRALAEAHSTPGTGLQIELTDLQMMFRAGPHEADNPLGKLAALLLQHFGQKPPDLTIRMRSEIPIASGMGSGAAISTALGKVLLAALDIPYTLEELNELVFEVEKFYHGTPSGIDNTVIVYEQPIFFVKDHPIEKLNIARPFRLLIGDTGDKSLTKDVVDHVRKQYESDPSGIKMIFEEIGGISAQARQHIESGSTDSLGPLMIRNHELLQKLGTSSKKLDRCVEAAVGAGALGAKLSGAGRGGNMIVLANEANEDDVKTALLRAGAVKIIDTEIKPSALLD